MHAISENFVTPVRKFQTQITSLVPFSVAELLIALVLLWILLMLVKGKFGKLLSGLVTLGLFAYAVFCLMWGTYYFGDPGLEYDKQITLEQLTTVTKYFADMSDEYYTDEPDRNEIIEKSGKMNNGIAVKPIQCSKIMSYLDFAGFFFPFTGEANVNMDMPAHSLASTSAHELAHLNGISKEMDANFIAVKTSLEYGDRDYVYSSALMAYTYLSNALYSSDYEAWKKIASSLSANVQQDLQEDREYWAQFDTPAKTASNTVYDGFLKSYDQEMGIHSYDACVYLLVNYYYPVASK